MSIEMIFTARYTIISLANTLCSLHILSSITKYLCLNLTSGIKGQVAYTLRASLLT